MPIEPRPGPSRTHERPTRVAAGAIVLGPGTRPTLGSDVTAFIAGHAPTHVIVLNPRAGALGRPVEATADVGELALLWDDSPPQPRQLNRSYSGRGGLRTRHWITNDVLRVASI